MSETFNLSRHSAHSLTAQENNELIHPLTLTQHTHSLTHSFSHSLTHLPTHLLTHSLTYPLIHSHTHNHTHILTFSLIHSFTHSCLLLSCYSWQPILEHVNDQFERYLNEEVSVTRKRTIPDTRVHCCLYFIAPTGHW